MGARTGAREIVMNVLNAFLNWCQMGGYAAYVWPAYLSVLFVFIIQLRITKAQTKRVMRWLKRGSNLS